MQTQRGDAEREPAQGWDLPQSMREKIEPERPRPQPQPSATQYRRKESVAAWAEMQRGCWRAAGATAFFAVVLPLLLLAMSLMGISILSVLAGLFR